MRAVRFSRNHPIEKAAECDERTLRHMGVKLGLTASDRWVAV